DGGLLMGSWNEKGGTIGYPAKRGVKINTPATQAEASTANRPHVLLSDVTGLVGFVTGFRMIGLSFRPSSTSARHKNANTNPKYRSKNAANVRSRLKVAATYILIRPMPMPEYRFRR